MIQPALDSKLCEITPPITNIGEQIDSLYVAEIFYLHIFISNLNVYAFPSFSWESRKQATTLKLSKTPVFKKL